MIDRLGSDRLGAENYEIVQRNKETGEEKLFLHDLPWNVSLEAAEKGASIRRRMCSEKWEVFIRQVDPVH